MFKPAQPAYRYFDRSVERVPDGREYNQRTLQAVNTTAYNVGSFRQLIIALTNAKPGETIIINETIETPETIVIDKPLTIRCQGRGKFIPTTTNIDLFKVLGFSNNLKSEIERKATGCIFENIVVEVNDLFIFHKFIDFIVYAKGQPIQEIGLQNISVSGCRVQSAHFLYVQSNGLPPKVLRKALGANNTWSWLGQRSYISNNVHIVDDSVVFNDKYFVGPVGFMCTIKDNETQNSHIFINAGTGNFIRGNIIAGFGNPSGSIVLNSTCEQNVIVDNLLYDDVKDEFGAAWPIGVGVNVIDNNLVIP